MRGTWRVVALAVVVLVAAGCGQSERGGAVPGFRANPPPPTTRPFDMGLTPADGGPTTIPGFDDYVENVTSTSTTPPPTTVAPTTTSTIPTGNDPVCQSMGELSTFLTLDATPGSEQDPASLSSAADSTLVVIEANLRDAGLRAFIDQLRSELAAVRTRLEFYGVMEAVVSPTDPDDQRQAGIILAHLDANCAQLAAHLRQPG